MSLRKIFQDSFFYGVIPKITTLVNVILLPIITPFLTPYDYGVWGVITSYTGLFVAIAPLGLHLHLSNSFFEYKKWNILWGHIFYLFLLSGLIFSILFVFIIYNQLNDFSINEKLSIAICSSFPILLFGSNVISSHLYPLKSNPKPLVFRNLIAGLSSIIVSFITIYYLNLGFWGFILGSMTSSIVGFLLFIRPLFIKEKVYPIVDRKFKRIKLWIKISCPVIPHALGFLFLSSTSRIIMNFYNIPLDDIGIYSNGYMIGDYLTIISTSLITAISPKMQIAYRNERFYDYRNMFYMCQIIVLASVFCASLWMNEIYTLLIRNSKFNESISIASCICYANVLMPLYSFISQIIFIEKNTKQLLWLVFVPGLLNLFLCFIFIPIYGYKVAVYSTLVSYWSLLVIPFVSKYHKRKIKVWLGNTSKLLYLLFVLISSIILSNIINDSNVAFKILISAILLFLLLFILRNKKFSMLFNN